MMWVVHCMDAPDAAAKRAAHRAEHSSNLKAQSAVSVVTGGPLLAHEQGAGAIGSFFLVEADHRAQVERFVAADPFSVRGIWAEVRIHAFLASRLLAAVAAPVAATERVAS